MSKRNLTAIANSIDYSRMVKVMIKAATVRQGAVFAYVRISAFE